MTLLLSLFVFALSCIGMYHGGVKWRETKHEQWFIFIVLSMVFMLISGFFLNIAVQEFIGWSLTL